MLDPTKKAITSVKVVTDTATPLIYNVQDTNNHLGDKLQEHLPACFIVWPNLTARVAGVDDCSEVKTIKDSSESPGFLTEGVESLGDDEDVIDANTEKKKRNDSMGC